MLLLLDEEKRSQIESHRKLSEMTHYSLQVAIFVLTGDVFALSFRDGLGAKRIGGNFMTLSLGNDWSFRKAGSSVTTFGRI